MTQEEHDELRAMIAEIHGGDVRLGRVLHALLDHVAGATLEKQPHRAPVEEEAASAEPTPIPRRASRQP